MEIILQAETEKTDVQIKKSLQDGSPIIAILVISCNRITVQRCLDQLLRLRPNADQFPIIVSQDCGHQQTSDIIESYGDQVIHIKVTVLLFLIFNQLKSFDNILMTKLFIYSAT